MISRFANPDRFTTPPGKVLIIEDEPGLLAVYTEHLTNRGFSVTGASNGAAGLEAARRQRPDVVVCDITMPKLNGFEVLKAMRADPELCGASFLFVTASGAPAELRSGMNQGADDYLAKPVSLTDLYTAVCARLARRREQRTAAHHPATLRSLGLTGRECDVLFWVAEGKTNPEIAIILSIGRSTVKTHLKNIFAKTGAHNRLGVAALASHHLRGAPSR